MLICNVCITLVTPKIFLFLLKVLELDDLEFKVSFVRDRGGYYTFPPVEDVAWVSRDQIKQTLDHPVINTRGHFSFSSFT